MKERKKHIINYNARVRYEFSFIDYTKCGKQVDSNTFLFTVIDSDTKQDLETRNVCKSCIKSVRKGK